MKKHIEPSPLKLFAAAILGIVAIVLFICSLFEAQTDAQGALVVAMVLPILGGLVFAAKRLARGSKFVSRIILFVVALPIGLLYVSFFFKPLGFVAEFVMKTISQEFERQSGVTPFEWGKGTRAIHFAARKGDVSKIDAEIQKGVSVDLKNDYDETPLFFAAEQKQLAVCKRLISLGANVNQQMNSKWTALHIASDYGFLEIVKLLAESEVDVNLRNMDGKTALTLAKEKNNSLVVDYLQSHGATE